MAVTVKLPVLKQLKQLNSATSQRVVGRIIVDEMKSFITKGISPVMGYRRFVAYKNPDRYPADKKPNRPVDMTLTGEMLRALTFRVRSGEAFELGWWGEQAVKANNHNTGDTVPERRLIPNKQGEQFNVSITRKLKNSYARLLEDLLGK